MPEDWLKFSENLPPTALKFYVKLYNAKNKKLQRCNKEAIQSWIHLSPEDKQFIIDKYDMYCQSQKNKHAEYLKNLEPYLKKKPNLEASQNTSQDISFEEQPLNNSIATNNESMKAGTQENVADQSVVIQPTENEVLVEPLPPKFKSAKDLYCMMQSMNEEVEDVSWSSLPTTKKRRFQAAATMLRKDYIDNYIRYLKSLPSIELYKLLKKNQELNEES